MTADCSLAIHTVFVARESIAHLREWIEYHALLGVDRFYLYDNTGSIGYDGSTSTTNKYGINFRNQTIHLTESDISRAIENIISDVDADVTLIKWTPTNGNGNIIYNQVESIKHCVQNHGNAADWMAFIDLDEFLFSPKNIDIKDHLTRLQRMGCGRAIIYQKKFLDRLSCTHKYVTDIYNCIEGINTSRWGPKNINRVADIDLDDIINVHIIPVNGRAAMIDRDFLRFNHYNVNLSLLAWMKSFYRTTEDFRFNALDSGMQRYQERLHQRCHL